LLERANAVRGWEISHPSQSIAREPDGALTVRFRAGGLQEMCWHLFTWGTAVSIVAPEELREELAGLAAVAATHHRRRHDKV
jgi:predicted DNA-binding transcriptional regulator YafY